MTKIEYLDLSWNPIAMRCTPVSEGCANCWHRVMANRLRANTSFHLDVRRAYAGEGPPVLIQKRLEGPLHRKKPTMYGVQFMGDLFHNDVPDSFIARVFTVMGNAGQHTYQILTKRPARMKELLSRKSWYDDYSGLYQTERKNWWFGVSVENQAAADERIPLLLQTPAATRFVSCEPLLGPVDISPYMLHPSRKSLDWDKMPGKGDGFTYPFTGPSWVICGGESGPSARPMHPNWARSIRDQCQAAGVPYFHKQNGEWLPGCKELLEEGYGKVWTVCPQDQDDKQPQIMWRVGKKAAGRLLDGVLHEEYPK